MNIEFISIATHRSKICHFEKRRRKVGHGWEKRLPRAHTRFKNKLNCNVKVAVRTNHSLLFLSQSCVNIFCVAVSTPDKNKWNYENNVFMSCFLVIHFLGKLQRTTLCCII